ncbi:FxLD family lanthipeptide [Streptomyces albidoflavus]|uniref:FxLD family lanthipeptide n=1 Tax=Streptomyces albidoflavus TaxID=1886 RepID=UPI000A1C8988|nr:FxLD family lanthipeptide [Streptomyces albidoflavus]
MANSATTPTARAVPGDPFDLDVTIVESSDPAGITAASDGGCQATCGSGACTSSGA